MNIFRLPLKIKVNSFLKLINQLGYVNANLYLFNRFFNLMPFCLNINKYYFASQPLSKQPILSKNKWPNYNIVELSSVKDFEFNYFPRPVAVFEDRIQQGAICLACYKNDEFTGFLWYIKKKFREDEVRCLYNLPFQSVWDFDVYVEPKYRLSPVFLKLWDEVSFRLTQDGCFHSLSRISAFNAISLQSHKRMGAIIIGWAVFIKIGVCQLTVSNLKPILHLSFSEKTYPIFNFN